MKFNSLLFLLPCLLLSSCVLVPERTRAYDKDCDMHYRQYTLKAAEYQYYQQHCHISNRHSNCLLELIFVPAGSLVISGSIVIVGNVVNWLEKEMDCALEN